jgi:hypothetical protein
MATYISVADIEAMLGDIIFSSATSPTDAEVEQFIQWVEAEIEARLRRLGIKTPVDDTASKKLVQGAVLWGASALALEALTSQAPTESDNARLRRWWDMFERSVGLLLAHGGEHLYDADRETSPRINMLPTLFGDSRYESMEQRLSPRRLAAKWQYEDDTDFKEIIASWKAAAQRV